MPSFLSDIPWWWKVYEVYDRVRLLFAAIVAPGGGEANRRPGSNFLPPSNEEQQLFKDIAEGNQQAFQDFYERTSARVYGYCLRMADSPAEASDLLQTTYMGLWQARERLAAVVYPRAYLMRVASRVVYRFLSEKNGRKNYLASLQHAEELVAPEVAAAVSLETKEILQLIAEAVRGLPEQQQEVFRLTKYEGLSYKEAAEQLGLTHATVRSYLEIAMKKVRFSVLGR